MLSPDSKILSLPDAVRWRGELRRRGIPLAVTNGCFDILHRGHAQYLFDARSCAGALLVLVNSDSSIRRLKGPSRPVCSERDRAFLLAALESVDRVTIFDSDRCDSELSALEPDVYVKGGDYTVEKLNPVERAALERCGASFRFIPFVPGFSTTNLIGKILASSGKR